MPNNNNPTNLFALVDDAAAPVRRIPLAAALNTEAHRIKPLFSGTWSEESKTVNFHVLNENAHMKARHGTEIALRSIPAGELGRLNVRSQPRRRAPLGRDATDLSSTSSPESGQ